MICSPRYCAWWAVESKTRQRSMCVVSHKSYDGMHYGIAYHKRDATQSAPTSGMRCVRQTLHHTYTCWPVRRALYTEHTTLHRPGGQRGRPDSVARAGGRCAGSWHPGRRPMPCAPHLGARWRGAQHTAARETQTAAPAPTHNTRVHPLLCTPPYTYGFRPCILSHLQALTNNTHPPHMR